MLATEKIEWRQQPGISRSSLLELAVQFLQPEEELAGLPRQRISSEIILHQMAGKKMVSQNMKRIFVAWVPVLVVHRGEKLSEDIGQLVKVVFEPPVTRCVLHPEICHPECEPSAHQRIR